MAHVETPSTPRTTPGAAAPARAQADPRWRNDASFTLLVISLLLMVLTLAFWVG